MPRPDGTRGSRPGGALSDDARYQRLLELAERHERGEISDAEFTTEKKRILRQTIDPDANARQHPVDDPPNGFD